VTSRDQSRYQSEQSVNQVNYNGTTTSLVVGSSAVGAYKKPDRYVETFVIGIPKISELRHR